MERGRTGAVLTPAGEEAADRAARALSEVEELVRAVQSAGEPFSGVFRLGAIPTIAPFLLPRVLPLLKRKFPKLRLQMREDLTSRWRTLDPAERREEEAELERLQVEAGRAAQDLRSDLAKTEQRLLGGMLRAIVRIAGKVGKQEGYDLVVDRRQARVFYAADSADLTDEVIAAYDAEVKETERGR